MFKAYDNNWRAIVQPPRFEYSTFSLGAATTQINGHIIERTDFIVKGVEGQDLHCSYFSNKSLPRNRCLVYLHSFGMCRTEGLSVMNFILPHFNFLVYDSIGCGKSGGEYLTLGIKESNDLNIILKHVESNYGQTQWYLWGRSMGAVTAILFLNKKILRS